MRFILRHSRLLVVVPVGPAVPIPCDVAIAVERHQRPGTRPDAEAGHQREIAAGGMTDHRDALRIYAKGIGPLSAQPCIRVLQIRDDPLQFGFRRQAVIDGNNRIPCLDVPPHLFRRDRPPMPEHQGATVQPENGRTDGLPEWPVDIRSDLAIPGHLVDIVLSRNHNASTGHSHSNAAELTPRPGHGYGVQAIPLDPMLSYQPPALPIDNNNSRQPAERL